MSKLNQQNPMNKSADLNFNTPQKSERLTMIYKALYQLNDIVLGIIFLIGSFLFFSDTTVTIGTVLFVIGSIQMTVRPLIAFSHDLHLAHKYKKIEMYDQ
ncbi:YrhK family protein [Staphylococcus equorum]|uniref:YrhK family protein n=1 Tax=Staphylococcus equorum TaxID=246432 RepID=A0A9X4LGK6_9STAP|nr:YrhK family protein [Staphylococcus equorum]MDG0843721.1 YrhK family protein [Staphylococcus equorum]MDG0859718.1 YrhK family protein [Staphylococcus equorum]